MASGCSKLKQDQQRKLFKAALSERQELEDLPFCCCPESAVADKIEERCSADAQPGAPSVVMNCVVIDDTAEDAEVSS